MPVAIKLQKFFQKNRKYSSDFRKFCTILCYNIAIKLDVVQHRILSYAARVRRHRKDWDNIKTAPKEKFTHTPTQLKNLVEAAQRGEQEAIDKLCHDFAPLIYKEAKGSNVQNALGEDAVNTAWVIFLEFIQRYKGNNFRLLPGLVRKHVHYGLLDKINRKKSVNDTTSLEAHEQDSGQQLAAQVNEIGQFELQHLLKEALSELSEKQRKAINELILNDIGSAQFCQKYKCSQKTAFKHRASALKKLKSLIV